MGNEMATKATAAAKKATDSELGIVMLDGAQVDGAYPVADGIWLTSGNVFLADGGSLVCNLKLRPFAA